MCNLVRDFTRLPGVVDCEPSLVGLRVKANSVGCASGCVRAKKLLSEGLNKDRGTTNCVEYVSICYVRINV